MKATTRYPFAACVASQLSFPAGAEIDVKSESSKEGWIWGSFGGQKGWLPASYIELKASPPSPPYRTANTPPAANDWMMTPWEQQQQRPVVSPATYSPRSRSRVLDVPEGLRASVGFQNQSGTSPPFMLQQEEEYNPDANNDFRGNCPTDQNGFSLMGGNPGSLFGSCNVPLHRVPEQHAEEDAQQREEEVPVDVYRHGSPRRKTGQQLHCKSDYNEYISVEITPKAKSQSHQMPSSAYGVEKLVPHQQINPTDFWNAHPGRVPGNTSAEQAYKLEAAFEGIDKTQMIDIVVEQKKNKALHVPRALKRTWAKAKEGIMNHH